MPKALNIQVCTEIDVQIEMDMVYRWTYTIYNERTEQYHAGIKE